jgi:ubiquinone/menaquinone biosynthesis C-methylase UbiE
MGTGALSPALARAAPGAVAVDGIDLSPGMLRAAETALSVDGVPMGTRPGDLTALPYADARFDLAIAAHAVEYLPDSRAALREMVRVARPGGRVAVCATRSRLRGFPIQLGWRTRRIAPATLAAWMRGAGLTRVRRLNAG